MFESQKVRITEIRIIVAFFLQIVKGPGKFHLNYTRSSNQTELTVCVSPD